ncbi:MAG TPA: glutamate synthase central domain-containing protein, partial [Treponemataceae bacterium]|nr:glutamate synthase central domain-containing protein [Treponemataceae bacterium]
CKASISALLSEAGLSLLGWRRVPVNNAGLGPSALASEPVMEMLFAGADPAAAPDPEAFDRKLFVVRKQATHLLRGTDKDPDSHFYICSLSCRVMVYKGMLSPDQLVPYFPDLSDPDYVSHLAMVHSRFSTNTFPSWDRAQPLRYMAHNGEINTLRGNVNKMISRQGMLSSPLFGPDLAKAFPVTEPDLSDSGNFDNVLELLLLGGRSLPEAVMMMIPEAWENHADMDSSKRDFYRYSSSMMEPWDGPASISFTDGEWIGAVLDRNGLRPSRIWITNDDMVIMASEVGVLDIDPSRIVKKTRLEPGKMFLVDFKEGRIIGDEEIKGKIATAHPYGEWLKNNELALESFPAGRLSPSPSEEDYLKLLRAFGYSLETVEMLLKPMVEGSQEALGSMGNDTPLAVLSSRPKLVSDYFKELFAQVTNPPIDSIREDLIMSLESCIGPEGNLLEPSPEHCRRLRLHYPILTDSELARLKNSGGAGWKTRVIDITYPVEAAAAEAKHAASSQDASSAPGTALKAALSRIEDETIAAIAEGCRLVVLSDRSVSSARLAVPALLAVGAVHQHLVRESSRAGQGRRGAR